MDAKLYNQEGAAVGTIALDPAMFGVAPKPSVIKRAVVMQQANARRPIAHTKTRSEVRGGGRKPWRQKGTGRARHGSIRSPIWVGGGVTFGPRSDRNHAIRMNKKEWRKALFMVLSQKASEEKIVILDSLSMSAIKTKHLAALVRKLPNQGKRTLLVQPEKDLVIARSARNIPTLTTIMANSVNVVDILRNTYLLMPKASLDVLKKTYLK